METDSFGQLKVHNCMDCPMAYVRTRGKGGKIVKVRRNCTAEICDAMMDQPTKEEIELFMYFTAETLGAESVNEQLYEKWLENVKQYKMAEAPMVV